MTSTHVVTGIDPISPPKDGKYLDVPSPSGDGCSIAGTEDGMCYEIVRWNEYQRYNSKTPPQWIRLYSSLLTSKTWVLGSDSDRVLMVILLLLAARTNNAIPASPNYIRKFGAMEHDPDLSYLLSQGFVALKHKNATVKDVEEKERRRARPADDQVAMLTSRGVTEQTAAAYIEIRRAKRAPLTEIAVQRLELEAAKAKMTLNDALTECCMRGWQGFKASWMTDRVRRASAPADVSGWEKSHGR